MRTDIFGQTSNHLMTTGYEMSDSLVKPNFPRPAPSSSRSGNEDSPNPSSPALSTTSSGSTTSGRAEPPKRLRYWLIDMINGGTIPGLKWEDCNRTVFRIPWKHAGKNNWKEEDCRIFKAWAEHRGKFKKGDKIDAATWKTRLRCALNKLPDIKELKENSCLEGNEPYRVYQLLPEPDKTQEYEIYPRNTWAREASPNIHSNNDAGGYVGYDNPVPLPTNYNRTSPHMYGDAGISRLPLPTDPSQEFSRMKMDESPGGYTINKLDIIPPPDRFSGVEKSILPSTNFPEETFGLINGNLQAELASPSGSEASSTALNMDYNNGYCENIRQDMTLRPMDSIQPLDLQKVPEAHEMEIYIRYRGVTVQAEHVSEKTGCRIYFGDATIQHIAKVAYDLSSIIFGPDTLHQISLTNCEPYAASQKQIDLTRHVLENLKRGLMLYMEDGCFYAKRLCQSRVFILGPETSDNNPEKLERSNPIESNRIKVFDYRRFCEKLRLYSGGGHLKPPEMEVKASFGQNWSIKNPIEKNLVTMYMIPRAAKYLLMKVREKHNTLESFNNSILDSGPDSYDRLAEKVMLESVRGVNELISQMADGDSRDQFGYVDPNVPNNNQQQAPYQSGFFQQNLMGPVPMTQPSSIMNDVEMDGVNGFGLMS